MTRSLTAGIQTEIAADEAEHVHFIEITFSGGTERYNTGTRDIDWNSFTWEAVGGALEIGPVEESADPRGMGMGLTLSSVDQTIVSALLTNDFRGYALKAWFAYLNTSTGVVISNPIPIFDGLQLEGYEVEERNERDRPGTVTVRTRAVTRFILDQRRGIQANVHSHQHHYPSDTFFQHVASLAGRRVYWGTEAPTPLGGSLGPGGGGDNGNKGGGDTKA